MSKIGAHVSGHPRHNYEAFCRAKPAVILSLDDGGALGEAVNWSGGHTITIFRDTSVYGTAEAPGDINNPPGSYAQMASYWYPKLMAKWALNPSNYFQNTNEQGGNDRQSYRNLVAYEREVMKLANADGYKVCVLNLAGGSPESFQMWVEECIPFIREAFDAGNIYGRHAYEGNWQRVYQEAQYLIDNGLGYGGMVVTEWGFDGGYGKIHDPQRIMDEDAALMAFPNVIAFCVWELGKTGFNANFDDKIPELTPYMLAHPTDKWRPGTPLPSKTLKQYLWDESVTIQKSMGLYLNPEAALQKELNRLGLQIVHNEATRRYGDESYVIQGGESLAGTVPRHTVAYQPGKPILRITDPYQQGGDPLEGLVIAAPFKVPFVLTSPYGEQRDYDDDGIYDDRHEGVDYDVVGGPSDSKEPVLCGCPGVVVKSGQSGGNYGYRTIVKCNYRGAVFYLWYAHMDSTYVQPGDSVGVGSHLGELGDTGRTTGEHVHINLQLESGGNEGPEWAVQHTVNPDPYISKEIPSSGRVHIPNYFFPLEGDYGPIYMLAHSWDGHRERTQLQRVGNLSYVVKNNQWELREITDAVRLKIDTSRGNDEYYTVEGIWLPLDMSVGQLFQRTERVQVFKKQGCVPVGAPYLSTSVLKLAAVYDMMSIGGIVVHNVIRVEWHIENRLDETYWYAKGLGLVRWRKYTGEESWIDEWVIGQENNKREVIPCL